MYAFTFGIVHKCNPLSDNIWSWTLLVSIHCLCDHLPFVLSPWHKLRTDNESSAKPECHFCLLLSSQMLGMLKQLVYLDVSKNSLEMVDEQIRGCESLQDLLLSNNALTQLPGSIGKDNRLHGKHLRKMCSETPFSAQSVLFALVFWGCNSFLYEIRFHHRKCQNIFSKDFHKRKPLPGLLVC